MRPIMRNAIQDEVGKRRRKSREEEEEDLVYQVTHTFKNHVKFVLLRSEKIQIVNVDKDDLKAGITKVVEDGLEDRSLMPLYALRY